VNEFDHGRKLVVRGSTVTEATCGKNDQRRPQTLAAPANNVLRDAPDQRDVGTQSTLNEGIDRFHFVGN